MKWLLLMMFVTRGADALACPLCDSGTGREVRARIFDSDFGWNVAIAVAPFAVILLVVAWVGGWFERRQ